MYDYIEGKLIEKNPAFCVIETAGIGYYIHITLSTYSQLEIQTTTKLFIHQVIREDAHLLFGFSQPTEREIFRLLLTVSGIGANTARMILSSLPHTELRQAITDSNVAALQSVKGVGAKTAQRVIIDLRDKISKEKAFTEIFSFQDNRMKDEALSALTILGFAKTSSEKVIQKILMDDRSLSLEEVIKKALKLL